MVQVLTGEGETDAQTCRTEVSIVLEIIWFRHKNSPVVMQV